MNKKALQILLSFFVFILAAISAFFFEDYFRRLIRYFFKFSTDSNITFIGKNFHLFASGIFIISFGVFCLLLFKISDRKKPFNTLIVSPLFLISTFVISYIDSHSRILECTACDDGKLNIHYNAIDYDLIFITSLIISISPFLIKIIRESAVKK
ncbi:hypothetical protein [Flavobacterium sp.]|uniref:hypothetical protein n=1 Tax=Flavobacterium sp. TaxID=239 RepID=UPI00391B1308